MFRSLRSQLLLYFLIINAIVLFGFVSFLYMTAQKGVLDRLDTELRVISLDAMKDIEDKQHPNSKMIAEELEKEFLITPLIIKIIQFDRSTKAIEYMMLSSPDDKALYDIPLEGPEQIGDIDYFNNGPYRVSSMLISEQEEMKTLLQIAILKGESPFLDHLFMSLLIAYPILLIIFLFIADVMMNKIMRPVLEVTESVRFISANRLSQRLESQDLPAEIQVLVETFNDLLSRLEESFERILTFSSDASHELQTPLTVMRGELEVGLRRERTAVEYRTIIEEVLEETMNVQEIIEQLFLLAKKDTPELSGTYQELYLDELITDSVRQVERLANTKAIVIKSTEMIPVTIYASEALLKVVIINLLKNAIIYNHEEGEVSITVNEKREYYQIIIEDDGYGIAKEDMPFIFERFYRGDRLRSKQNSGSGLGLSIVKMILELHHYMIEFHSVLDKGSKVIVSIPK